MITSRVWRARLRPWLAGALLVALVLTGCGGDDDDSVGAPLQTVERPPTLTPTAGIGSPFEGLPAAANGELRLPLIESLPGGLLFLKDDVLYLSWFDGEGPTLVADVVHPFMIELSPDGSAVAYPAGETERVIGYGGVAYNRFSYILTVTDLHTMETTPLLNVGDERGVSSLFLGWAPDGQSVMVWDTHSLLLARRSGEIIALPDSDTATWQPGVHTVAWLPDSSVLLFATEEPSGTATPQAPGDVHLALYRYDPATAERTMVNLSIDDLALLDFMYLEKTLFERGTIYADTFNAYHRAARLPDGARVFIDWPPPVRAFQADLCSTWEVRQQSPGDTDTAQAIYTVNDTTFLTDLTALPDGSLLFLRWALADCQFSGAMTVELIQLVPGQAPVVITDEIDPGSNANPNDVVMLGTQRGLKYTVSPDGRYVFWIGGGSDTNTSSIRVTDLEYGVTATLLTDVVRPFAVGGFEDVFWVSMPED